MPGRFLRPALRTSVKWNRASYSAQSLYIAILTLVDDFGRYDGRATLLHGECRILREQTPANDSMPLPFADTSLPVAGRMQADVCNCQQTASDLNELHRIGLIKLYRVNEQEYLQVTNWQERIRQKKSKYPDPPGESDSRVQADASEPRANAGNCSLPTPSPNALRLAPTPSPETRAVADVAQHAEVQSALREIAQKAFGQDIGLWGQRPVWDHWLNAALPMPRVNLEALKWLYSLPEDHEIFSNRQHRAYTQRRQSFVGILQNLEAESGKAWTVRKKFEGAEIPAWLEAIPG